jgi:Ulp1 family protease
MTEADIKTAEPGNFINDNVVDFWMHWIQRKEMPNDSLVHIFSTHFYTELVNGGYDAVLHWTTNRGINIFQKKLIMIPIHKQKHWSLCAVMNHHYIDFGVE